MGGKGNLPVHKGNGSISHVENYNADDCCDQNDYNEELDNMVFFKKKFRVTGEQKNKSQHGKRHVYIVISPLPVQCDIIYEENVVQDEKSSCQYNKYPVFFLFIYCKKNKNTADDK